jgi:tight adherence protein C
MLILVVILVFITGTLLAVGLTANLSQRDPVQVRLDQVAAPREPGQRTPTNLPDTSPSVSFCRSWVRRMAEPLGSSHSLRVFLDRAGRPSEMTPAEFRGLRFVSVLLFLLLAPLMVHTLAVTLPMKIAVALLAVVIGLSLPDAWLQGKISTRQAHIRRSLPDVLDLLVVSMEAGVGFDAAVAQVTNAMRGPLPDEMRRTLQEMRLGRTRVEALRELALRVDVAELTSFITAVTQADRLGTGIAPTMRIQSETARTQRMQRVREAAAKLPTKLLFPLIFFLMPALFVVLLGPGLINLMHALSH